MIAVNRALNARHPFRTCVHRQRPARRTLRGTRGNSTVHLRRAECRPVTGKSSSISGTCILTLACHIGSRRLSFGRPSAGSTPNPHGRPGFPARQVRRCEAVPKVRCRCWVGLGEQNASLLPRGVEAFRVGEKNQFEARLAARASKFSATCSARSVFSAMVYRSSLFLSRLAQVQ
jgi:hypothetical protein